MGLHESAEWHHKRYAEMAEGPVHPTPERYPEFLLRSTLRKGETVPELELLNAQFFIEKELARLGNMNAREFAPSSGMMSRVRERLQKARRIFNPTELHGSFHRGYRQLAGASMQTPKNLTELRTRLEELATSAKETARAASAEIRACTEAKPTDELWPVLTTLQDGDFVFADENDSDESRTRISISNISAAASRFRMAQVALQPLGNPALALAEDTPQERFQDAPAHIQEAREDLGVIISELSNKRLAELRIQLKTEHQKAVQSVETLSEEDKEKRLTEFEAERVMWLGKIEELRRVRERLVALRKSLSQTMRAAQALHKYMFITTERLAALTALYEIPSLVTNAIGAQITRLRTTFAKLTPQDLYGVPLADHDATKENQGSLITDLEYLAASWNKLQEELTPTETSRVH